MWQVPHGIDPKPGANHAVKSNILVSTKIGMYGNNKIYFQPNIICRYITYVYDSKYFLGSIFNHKTIKF